MPSESFADLLPMCLPSRPALLWGPREAVIASRRRQSRLGQRRTAWMLAEWQVCLFNFYSVDCPANPSKARSRFDSPGCVTSAQAAVFETLVETNLRFGRLGPGTLPEPSRGLASFLSQISVYERAWAKYEPKVGEVFNSGGPTTALPVDPSRISIPANAGLIDPAEHLPEPLKTEFLNAERRVLPDWQLRPTPKCCYRVAAADEPVLRKMFLESGMATLVASEDVPLAYSGRPLLAGLFGVQHKAASDRLILDRRPANDGEGRLGWARLPYGPQLARLCIAPGQHVRCSCDDLKTYFYQLRNADSAIKRNVFGREFLGDQYVSHGAEVGRSYRLALRVVAMGDLNAVDIAHETHRQILKAHGAMAPQHELVYGAALPLGDVVEGLYIDDHFVIGIVPRHLARSPGGPDRPVHDASLRAYESSGLPRAPEKSIGFGSPIDPVPRTRFTVIGTEVCSDPGTVSAPMQKRQHLFVLSAQALSLKAVGPELLRRHISLFTHPFMHRRELMSVFGNVYTWLAAQRACTVVRWPPEVADEVAAASFCLPLAEAHIRWPVSTRFSATDATPDAGGACHTPVPEAVADALYRTSEFRGFRARLDMRGLDFAHMIAPPDPDLASLVRTLPWTEHRSRRFRRTEHINLQELEEVIEELRLACRRSLAPARLVNAIDSGVVLGAWARGRSSSRQVNRRLRHALGWAILGRKSLVNVHLASAENPADDASRFVPMRLPVADGSWVEALSQMAPLVRPAGKQSSSPGQGEFLEIFAGTGRLSAALARANLKVAVPLEAFPGGGVRNHRPSHDVLEPGVLAGLASDVAARRYASIHLGLPCKTWGPAGRLAGGTRRISCPWGTFKLPRELHAHREFGVTVILCVELVRAGRHFSVENPRGSCAFLTDLWLDFCSAVDVFSVDFDQCAFGLKFKDSGPNDFCKKPTRVMTSDRRLLGLARQCPGCSATHRHVHAWGSYVFEDRRVSRSAEAGGYPSRLCKFWAQRLAEEPFAPPTLRSPALLSRVLKRARDLL